MLFQYRCSEIAILQSVEMERTMETKLSENAVRKRATRKGYKVCKSREKTIHANNHGEFMLIDLSGNFCVAGANYDASIEEVAAWLDNWRRVG